jgi:hypothetical protein
MPSARGGADWQTSLFPQQTKVVPVSSMTQVSSEPALIALAGSPEPVEDWPSVLLPQHATTSLVRMPQVWSQLVLIALKVPAGGEDLRSELLPQQATVSSGGVPGG